jgi:hypothetical protein
VLSDGLTHLSFGFDFIWFELDALLEAIGTISSMLSSSSDELDKSGD